MDRPPPAVQWLERDYDQALELCTAEGEDSIWGRYIHFRAREIQKGSVGRLMFSVKEQNG